MVSKLGTVSLCVLSPQGTKDVLFQKDRNQAQYIAFVLILVEGFACPLDQLLIFPITYSHIN